MGKRLAAEPVGPEQDALSLVVEVLAEEVEFGAIRIGIGAHARILTVRHAPYIVAVCRAAVARARRYANELVSGRRHPHPARQPEANAAV